LGDVQEGCVFFMMISFDVGESQKFNLRVACLIIRDNRVLFQRFHHSDDWFLPGGRVEMMEETPDAINREIREEYGWTIKSKKLVWIVENFFRLDEKDFHELGLYYLVEIDGDVAVTEDFQCREGICVSRWIPIGELDRHRIVPEFIRQGIDVEQLMHTNEVKHIIHHQ